MSTKRKFAFSLVAFSALALLSWQTLSDDPISLHDRVLGWEVKIRFRTATLLVLGLWAVFTMLAFFRATIEERRASASKQD